MNTARVLQAATETEFQQAVIHLAALQGWRCNHTRRSIVRGGRWATPTMTVGWPDLTLWNPRRARFLVVELKTDTGRLTQKQREVLDELRACGIDARVWRPRDWGEVEATLTHREPA